MEPVQIGRILTVVLGAAFLALLVTAVTVWVNCWIDKRVNPDRWHYKIYAFSRSWIPNQRKIEDACTYMRHIFYWAPALAFFLGSPRKKQVFGMGFGFMVSFLALVALALTADIYMMSYYFCLAGLEIVIWYLLKLKTSERTREITMNFLTGIVIIAGLLIIGGMLAAVYEIMRTEGLSGLAVGMAQGLIIDTAIIIGGIIVVKILLMIIRGTRRALKPAWQAVVELDHKTTCPFMHLPEQQQTN